MVDNNNFFSNYNNRKCLSKTPTRNRLINTANNTINIYRPSSCNHKNNNNINQKNGNFLYNSDLKLIKQKIIQENQINQTLNTKKDFYISYNNQSTDNLHNFYNYKKKILSPLSPTQANNLNSNGNIFNFENYSPIKSNNNYKNIQYNRNNSNMPIGENFRNSNCKSIRQKNKNFQFNGIDNISPTNLNKNNYHNNLFINQGNNINDNKKYSNNFILNNNNIFNSNISNQIEENGESTFAHLNNIDDKKKDNSLEKENTLIIVNNLIKEKKNNLHIPNQFDNNNKINVSLNGQLGGYQISNCCQNNGINQNSNKLSISNITENGVAKILEIKDNSNNIKVNNLHNDSINAIYQIQNKIFGNFTPKNKILNYNLNEINMNTKDGVNHIINQRKI